MAREFNPEIVDLASAADFGWICRHKATRAASLAARGFCRFIDSGANGGVRRGPVAAAGSAGGTDQFRMAQLAEKLLQVRFG